MIRLAAAVAAAVGALAVLAAPSPVLAANARQPYSNIDRRVDAGNDTGDSRVEALNQQQLNQNGAVGGPRYSYLPPPGYAPRTAYYSPPPVYVAPPPVVYAPPPVVYAPYPRYRYYRPYYPY